jgi:teichuronic acid biosynthesis glycosyltransferase TuaC
VTGCLELAVGEPARRVMFVTPGTGEGSSMIFARRQAEAVRAQGVEVLEFFLRSRTSPTVIVREMLRFRRELRRFGPDVIHAQYGTVTSMFAALGAGKIPLVITYRGSDLNPCPGGSRVRTAVAHLLSQLAALRAARIVCVSRQLRARLWWRRHRVTILATGVDAAAFEPAGREAARLHLGWSTQGPAVLFNRGRDPEIKRLDLAEAAIGAARRATPDLRWEVLDGSTAPELVPVLMNAADCLLVTSDFEGSPAVVQEALASNLPIVSVEVGDIAERLAGVRHSRIVARDPEKLGAALAEMVETPRRSDGRRKIGEIRGEHIAGRLREIYEEVSGVRAKE